MKYPPERWGGWQKNLDPIPLVVLKIDPFLRIFNLFGDRSKVQVFAESEDHPDKFRTFDQRNNSPGRITP
jgi:hypothetical protein